MQETWDLFTPDSGRELTAVAIGIAKLGDPTVVLNAAKSGGGFVASGRAPSVAAGRLSYTHGLKVWPICDLGFCKKLRSFEGLEEYAVALA